MHYLHACMIHVHMWLHAECTYIARLTVKFQLVLFHTFQMDDEKPEDWKSKLSPAFSEEEILYSLLILGNFYVVYVIVKASFDVHDNSVEDEQRFVQNCFCSLNQRIFYRFWFGFCVLLWILIHSYSFFAQLSALHQFEDVMKVFLAFCIVCPCYSLNGVYKCLNQCLSKCCCKNKEQYESISESTEFTASSTINNIVQGNKIKLVRKNISLLWFQYCKLYVIGYTRYYDKRQPIKIIMEKNNSKDDVDNGETKNGCCFLECKKRGEDATCTHPCCCLRCSRQCCSQYGNESTCPDINIMCCNKYFPDRFLSKDITRAFVFLNTSHNWQQFLCCFCKSLILIHFFASVQIHTVHIQQSTNNM